VGLIVTVSDLLPKVAELRLLAILLDGDAASVTMPSGANLTLCSDLVDGVQTEYRRPPTKRSDTAAALLYSSLRARRGRARASSLRLPTLLRGPSDRIVSDSGLDSEEETHEYGSRVGLYVTRKIKLAIKEEARRGERGREST